VGELSILLGWLLRLSGRGIKIVSKREYEIPGNQEDREQGQNVMNLKKVFDSERGLDGEMRRRNKELF